MTSTSETNITTYDNIEDISKDFSNVLQNKSLDQIAKLITSTKFKINGQEYSRFEDLPKNVQETITKNNFRVLEQQMPTIKQAKIISADDTKKAISSINIILKTVTYITSFGTNFTISNMNFAGGNHIPLPISIISSIGVAWLANKLNDRRQKQTMQDPQQAGAMNLTKAMGIDTSILSTFTATGYSILLNLPVIFIEEWLFRQI